MFSRAVFMAITPTTNWNNIQRRAVDPYSLYTSENINFLNAIIGKDRARIVGLNAEYLYDVPTGNLFIHLSAGVCIKDYVLISFNDDVYVSVGTWPVSAGAYLIVVDYKFETKYPPNIARISVINESEYDGSQHMALYRLTVSGITYPGSLYLETVEELTNFDRSAEEAISMLQDHITNNSAHTHLFYTKQQIDNMLLSQTIDPETLAALLSSLLPVQLDADGDYVLVDPTAPVA